MDENKVEVKKKEKFPLPFDTEGWMWNNIPLLFWILLQIIYLAISIPVVAAGILIFIVICIMVLLVYPLIYTIVISIINPDGRAINKIKKIWAFDWIDGNEKKNDSNKDDTPYLGYSPDSGHTITSDTEIEKKVDNSIDKDDTQYSIGQDV
jgi:hypothetical protein